MAASPDGNGATATHVSVAVDIFAPRHFVWNIHTNINAWCKWQPDIAYAVIEEPPAPGVPFRWRARETAITSMIEAVDEAKRILWCSATSETMAMLEWTFTDSPNGVQVTATESLCSPSELADPAELQMLLERSLTFWLRRLKKVAESR